MPVVYALHSLVLGRDKDRKVVKPGERVQLTDEEFKELSRRKTPCIQSARERDREMNEAAKSEADTETVSKVAEPEKSEPEKSPPIPERADENVSRAKPPAEDADEL